MTVVLKNPLRSKQLQQGLMELGEEGAIQVFKPDAGGNMLPPWASCSSKWCSTASRPSTTATSPRRLPVHRRALDHRRHAGRAAQFENAYPQRMAHDAANTLAYLCTSPYDVRLAQERFPKIHFIRCASTAALSLSSS